jgi:hypothetical protein
MMLIIGRHKTSGDTLWAFKTGADTAPMWGWPKLALSGLFLPAYRYSCDWWMHSHQWTHPSRVVRAVSKELSVRKDFSIQWWWERAEDGHLFVTLGET